MAQNDYDYIIVGGGSAGCVLAHRLTEDKDVNVLVLEAGGQDSDPWIKIPLVWLRKFVHERRHDWGYDTEPEPHMDNREIECVRARVLGGCSSINAMTVVRGNRGDYDRWAESGLDGWGYQDVLPYFKRMESWAGGADPYRGDSGPFHIQQSTYSDPMFDSYMDACENNGVARTPDYNGAQQEGVAKSQQNIKNGRRFSAADAYLRPALNRPNLTLQLNKLITGLVFDGTRAVGVQVQEASGALSEIRCTREVILSAGALNTPHLLMLSGIGPADQLKAQGVAVRLDAPEVGQNLQDHISAGLQFRRKTPGPFVAHTRADRLALSVARAYLTGKGPATDFPGGMLAFVKSEAAKAVPDLQILFWGAPVTSGPWFPGIKSPWQDAFGLRAAVLHPHSRGSLELASSDPTQRLRLRQNFLREESDRKLLLKGLRLCREISMDSSMDWIRGEEVLPGAGVTDDDGLLAHARKTGISVHHPAGTCRMGGDGTSPVDGELRLRGVEGLRVVDASVMPDLISGNIHAAVLVIAERASDIILGRETLEPAGV